MPFLSTAALQRSSTSPCMGADPSGSLYTSSWRKCEEEEGEEEEEEEEEEVVFEDEKVVFARENGAGSA